MARIARGFASGLLGMLAASPLAFAAANISGGYYEDASTPFPARNSDFNLVGDAWFGWQTGTITGNLNLSQYNFQMQTGGGNVTTFSGALSGTGEFDWYGGGSGSWQTTASFLNGNSANTLQGIFDVEQGTLALGKPAGVNAIAGPLIIGGGANQAIVRLDNSNEIKDTVPITLAGGYTSSILTQGHSETAGTLNVQANGIIDLGAGTSTVKFADSTAQSWKFGKSLTVQNYNSGSDHLYFGSTATSISNGQLAQVSFTNPSGKAAGVYSATIQSSGEVVPTNTLWTAPAPPSTSPNFQLVPYPRSLTERTGSITLTPSNSVVVGSPSLMTLGSVLSNEIFVLTGNRLNVRTGTAAAGDISLQMNSGLSGEAYSLDVQSQAVVSGGNYQAISEGTVTLLQSLKSSAGTTTLPRVRIDDYPQESYRATMIDLAREPTSIATIEKQIELNRLYKIPYLQLHLSDDQAFTFPVTSVTGINGHNGKGPDDQRTIPTYTKQQLTDLVSFADARGVTLIPEIEMPGHAGQMVSGRPDLFSTGWYHGSTLNIANPAAVTALKSIVSEVASVFKSSPYFHIGGDEADFSQLNYGYVNYINGNPQPTVTPAARAQWDAKMDQLTTQLRASGAIGATDKVTSATEVYRDFLNQMDNYIVSLGKKMIAWEGFGPSGQVPVNKDINVMSFENAYYRPDGLTKAGYNDINASWSPLYVVSMQDDAGRTVHLAATLQQIYAWDKQHFDVYYGNVTPTSGIFVPDANAAKILGGELVAWENTEAVLIDSLRQRLAAMGEKLWTPDAPWTFADFSTRLGVTDAMLTKLFAANDMAVIGVGSASMWISPTSGDWNNSDNWSAGAPNAPDAEADFFAGPSSSHTINTDIPVTVGILNFNTANSYVLSGFGSLTLQTSSGSAQVLVQQGTQKINLPLELASNTLFNVSAGATLKVSDPMTVDAGVHLTTSGGGSVVYESTITLLANATMNIASSTYAHALSLAAAASVTLTPTAAGARTVLEVDSQSNTAGGTVNLNNNDEIIHGGTTLAAVTAQLTSGFNGGAWTGSGITSASAAGDSSFLHALGVMQAPAAGTFDGKAVAGGDVLVKYTWYGDADLSGAVTGNDYTLIDVGFNSHGSLIGWQNGDFNYDGKIDGGDYTLIDNTYNQQGSPIAAMAGMVANSTAEVAGATAVPEPGSLMLLGMGAFGLLNRRRRQ